MVALCLCERLLLEIKSKILITIIMQDVTIVILTKNEEINLKDCLDSVKGFAKRCVVVDSYSTDATEKVARDGGADFYEHKFENYARQFNWALDSTDIKTKWTFRLDADERLTPELCDELRGLMEEHDQDDVNGVTMEAWLYFMGRLMKHGGHQKRKLMLFKTGMARIEDRKMDEHTILSSGTSVYAKNRFIHYDFKDMTAWINKLNWYATREMQDYIEFKEGKVAQIEEKDAAIQGLRNMKFGVYYKFPKFLRCWLSFVYEYVFKLGFLDGKEGWIYIWNYCMWYRSLVDAKILEYEKFKKPFEQTGDLKY